MLFKLLRASDRGATEHVVVTLTAADYLAADIRKLGVRVLHLDVAGWTGGIRALLRTRHFAKEFRPHLVMTWLHHSDLFGAVLKCMMPSLRLVWNLRCSTLSPAETSRSNVRLVRLLALLSFLPTVVVSNSEAGKTEHTVVGYAPRRWHVLPNGFDTEIFAPDTLSRNDVREHLGLSSQHFVIGMVGRYHPMKGFGLFVDAAGRLARENGNVRFVLVGKDVDQDNAPLVSQLEQAGVIDKTYLLGQSSDVARVMNALDVLANTSTSEGFPNVIGEAMSCGIPCVATNVGDSAVIVGSSGLVVPAGDADALVDAWRRLWALSSDERSELKRSARKRIIENFEIGTVARRYQDLFNELASQQ